MLATLLDDYQTLAIGGADAARFLQGQQTQDVARLTPDVALDGAFLTPKGRVVALATLLARDGIVAILPAALAAPLAAQLARYVLRAKVTLALPGSDLALAALVPESESELGARFGSLPPGTHRALDAGVSVIGRRGYALLAGPAPALAAALGVAPTAAARAALELAAVRGGEPSVAAATSGEWIPQMLNLDLLDAISFSKGCYTGQEIVARTQHLGRIKRRMYRYRSEAPASALPAGTPLVHAGGKVGEVVRAAPLARGSELLAVVSVESAGVTLSTADGAGVVPEALPYDVP